MRIRNVSGVARAVTPPYADSFIVDADETVEVDAVLGESLLAQPRNWQPVRETADIEKENA